MTIRLVSDTSNVVLFPGAARERPSVELIVRLAPSRSLVDSLIAERGMSPHDVQAGFAREFAYQAQALEAGCGRAETIVCLGRLVDAHLAHAADMCRTYQDAADGVVRKEIELARAGQVPTQMRAALATARAELLGHAIAARVAADAALGASTALATYAHEGLADLPVSEGEPRQLLLFASTAC